MRTGASRVRAKASAEKGEVAPPAQIAAPTAGAKATDSQQQSREVVSKHPFVDGLQCGAVVEILLTDIDVKDLRYQYRVTTRVQGLRQSIERDGQQDPVLLTDSKPHLVIDGFRRVQAINELGWPAVKALVYRVGSEEDAHKVAFTKNVVRQNLSHLDKANAIRLAKERGLTHAAIAKELGISERQVFRYEKMLDLPAPLKGLLDAGEVSMAHAIVIAKFDGVDVVEWVEKAQDKTWSAGELRRHLYKDVANRSAARKHEYIKSTPNEARGYPWRLTEHSSPDETDRAIEALEHALTTLRSLKARQCLQSRLQPEE